MKSNDEKMKPCKYSTLILEGKNSESSLYHCSLKLKLAEIPIHLRDPEDLTGYGMEYDCKDPFSTCPHLEILKMLVERYEKRWLKSGSSY